VDDQVAVNEELPRWLIPGRKQHRRPVDAVEANDVLREQMRGGPEPFEVVARRVGQRAEVVDQRVGPNVGDLIRVPGDRHPPGLRRATDREVAESALDEAARLVRAEVREDEIGPIVVEAEQRLLVGGETGEPRALLEPLGLDAMVRALAVNELVLVLEGLAADAIPARIHVLVDVLAAVVVDALEELLDEKVVALIARPDEEVVPGV